MNPEARLFLVRHGETEWSREGKHTSSTDLPLTDSGEQVARALRGELAGHSFERVWSSPLLRARQTAELAGFGSPELAPDVTEWEYGDYEGVTTEEIRRDVPGWTVWSHPSPGGESAQQVSDRLDRFIAQAREVDADAIVFAHGHSLRALAARWLELPVSEGRIFELGTATVSVLGWYREQPVVQRWNAPVGS